MTQKLTIEELGYVEVMRQRLGLNPDDTAMDHEIENMGQFSRLRLIIGWKLGDPYWADYFKDYCESQGIWLTTDPEASGVF